MKKEQNLVLPHKSVVWTPLNYHHREKNLGWKSDLPSETIPDEALTVRQIIDRHARGIASNLQREGIYDEGDEFSQGIDARKLDLVDLQRMRIENEEKIANYRRRFETTTAEKLRLEREAYMNGEVEKKVKEAQKASKMNGKGHSGDE